MQHFIVEGIEKHIATLTAVRHDAHLLKNIEKITVCCINALKNKRKILLAGNGGSAADSQHLAAELVSRLQYNRPGLAAIALTTDTSALTAIGNDYGFDQLFSRQIEALGQPGDVFIAISTSGKSSNIIKALQTAREKHIATIGLTGANPNAMLHHCDELLCAPSKETPNIQECHIVFGHIICALIEESLYGEHYNPMYKQKVIA